MKPKKILYIDELQSVTVVLLQSISISPFLLKSSLYYLMTSLTQFCSLSPSTIPCPNVI
uniref:Uncharacterized protein n=1 Tax=Anguilla anguilla TaxID=7936 RepID=A0A0E9RP66_ANGAN